MTSTAYSITRLSSIEALVAARTAVQQGAPLDPAALADAAAAVEASVRGLDAVDPLARGYSEFAALLRATELLVRWGNAVRGAEADAGRFVLAARQTVRDLRRGTAPHGLLPTLDAAAHAIDAVGEIEDVEDVVTHLLTAPLPVPMGRRTPETRDRSTRDGVMAVPEWAAGHGTHRLGTNLEPTPVAFLRFIPPGDAGTATDGVPPNVFTLQPDVLYDLSLEVRLSRWPLRATHIEFTPLHVEPAGTLTVPSFVFNRPASEGDSTAEPRAVTLFGTGRLRVHGAHDLLARPLEITYAANATVASLDGDAEARNAGPEARAPRLAPPRIEVQGQRRLAIRSLDPRLTPITGFPDLDAHIDAVRGEARRYGVPDEELAPFLALLTASARLAQQAVTDALYPSGLREDEFQRDVRDRLRVVPTIGADLEEHSQAAGGITDLSFRRIPLELKVNASSNLTGDDVVSRYGQQTAQYVSASGRRCGVLVCLDTSAKTTAPGLVRNDVVLRTIDAPGSDGRPIVMGVVIVRGNLAKPSALSKGTPRTGRRA